MRSGEPRIVEVDLNDEVLGAGMPCGGSMEVFVEPVLPATRLFLFGDDEVANRLAEWSASCGFDVLRNPTVPPESEDLIVSRPTSVAGAEIADNHPGVVREGLPISAGTPAEEAVSLAAGLLIARQRSSGEPLWRAKEMPVDVQPLASRVASPHPKLVLVGHNRMTESLAELAVALDWHVTVNSPGIFSGEYPHSVCRVLDDEAYELDEVTPGSDVVIATQHKGDHRVLRSVLGRSPAYVGLIASRRRAGLIVEFLQREGLLRSARACLHTPCGLDLGARAPFEIALSIVSEIIAHRNA